MSPIPKVDNPTTNEELRPISILPVLSKLFERLVGWQMSEFANSDSLLHDNISSFREGHSTTTALLGIRDDIKRAMKRKEVTLMVLADFSKAFDTVCFKTTLKKFYKVGFSKNYLKWLLSYIYLVEHNSFKLMTLNHTANCHSLEHLKDRSSGR